MKAIVLSFVALAFAAGAQAETLTNAEVSWHASGNAGLVNIDGKGGKVVASALTVADGKASGTVEVSTTDFKTGIDLRDKHAANYLGADKHPTAKLELDPAAIGATNADWTGKLTLNGATHAVAGKARLEGDKLWAQFDVDRKDYGIEKPTYLGVGVEDVIKVTVKATVSK